MNSEVALLRFPVLPFLSILLLIGCTNSSSPNTQDNSQLENNPEEKKDTIESRSVTIKDTITCLDIAFIEQLESSWNSTFKDPKLAKKGFRRTTSRTIDYGKEIEFENSAMKTSLQISKSKYPDGEGSFSVHYFINPFQLDCLKKQLNNNDNYKIDSNNGGSKARYLKKGLGTYENKIIEIDSTKLTLFYIHGRGKELSLPELNFKTE